MARHDTPRDDTAQDMARPENQVLFEGVSTSLPQPDPNPADDTARHDMSPDDAALERRKADYRLTVFQIMERLDLEGLSKSKRTVQRWLKNDEIDNRLVDTAKGKVRLANEVDTMRYIEDLKRREALALSTTYTPDTERQPTPAHDMAQGDAPQSSTQIATPEPTPSNDTARHDAPQRDMSPEVGVLEERVAQLSDRLDDYKAESAFLREQVVRSDEHVKLWSDRAKELKQLLEAQNENIRPVLGTMARSIDSQKTNQSNASEIGNTIDASAA